MNYQPARVFVPGRRRITDGDRKQLTNQQCAEHAFDAVLVNSQHNTDRTKQPDVNSLEELIDDLLCNLMHLCDREQIDLNERFASAAHHHLHEK